MKYTIYHHTHSRGGFEVTEQLCFICASDEAATIGCDSTETIHPRLADLGSRTKCTLCQRKLNWMDT